MEIIVSDWKQTRNDQCIVIIEGYFINLLKLMMIDDLL